MEEIKRADPSDAGCWIEGHWGQYGMARLIEIAGEYGYNHPSDNSDAASVLASMGPSEHEATDIEWEQVLEAADDAEAWLNENVAPEGYSFGWYDGEFYLWSDEEWEMEP